MAVDETNARKTLKIYGSRWPTLFCARNSGFRRRKPRRRTPLTARLPAWLMAGVKGTRKPALAEDSEAQIGNGAPTTSVHRVGTFSSRAMASRFCAGLSGENQE
jgi:hypothetical protein